MTQIYNFEQFPPPIIRKYLLQKKLEAEKLRLQSAVLAAVAIVLQLILAVFALIIAPLSPALAAASLCYVFLSLASGTVLAVGFTRKRRFASCRS